MIWHKEFWINECLLIPDPVSRQRLSSLYGALVAGAILGSMVLIFLGSALWFYHLKRSHQNNATKKSWESEGNTENVFIPLKKDGNSEENKDRENLLDDIGRQVFFCAKRFVTKH